MCVCVCVCLFVCSKLVTFLNSWVVEELQPHFKDTPNTVEHYMLNARSFLKHLRDSPPPKSRLTTKACNTLVCYFDSLLKTNRKKKMERQHAVKKFKKLLLHAPEDIRSCLTRSQVDIPELLSKSISELTLILIITGLWNPSRKTMTVPLALHPACLCL